jgi:hypothetical protein
LQSGSGSAWRPSRRTVSAERRTAPQQAEGTERAAESGRRFGVPEFDSTRVRSKLGSFCNAGRMRAGRPGQPGVHLSDREGLIEAGIRSDFEIGTTTGRLQPSLTVHLAVPQPSPPSQGPHLRLPEVPRTCTEPPFAVPPTARSTWPPGAACSDRRHRPRKSPRFDRISE